MTISTLAAEAVRQLPNPERPKDFAFLVDSAPLVTLLSIFQEIYYGSYC